MIVVSTDYIEGKTLEMLGLVNGSTIQSKNIGKDFGAGLKSIVGGELTGYTEMMEEARKSALSDMEAPLIYHIVIYSMFPPD